MTGSLFLKKISKENYWVNLNVRWAESDGERGCVYLQSLGQCLLRQRHRGLGLTAKKRQLRLRPGAEESGGIDLIINQ